jgi:hypothetical protein
MNQRSGPILNICTCTHAKHGPRGCLHPDCSCWYSVAPDHATAPYEPIRIDVFTDRPGFLLLFVPPGRTFRFPDGLHAPFERVALAEALGLAGVDARVRAVHSDASLGRVFTKTENERRSERAQRESLREAREHSILRGSTSPVVAIHSECVLRKQAVDGKLRSLKAKLSEAKTRAATTGHFLPRADFLKLEQDVEDAKAESLALQSRMGELRRQEKREGAAGLAAEFSLFRKFTKELDPDLFEEIKTRVENALAEREDGTDGGHEP